MFKNKICETYMAKKKKGGGICSKILLHSTIKIPFRHLKLSALFNNMEIGYDLVVGGK